MSDSVSLSRRLAAEGLGTLLLAATVVGSGIMVTGLTADIGLQLLANALATGAILVVIITTLAPVSGAHFNPAVSFVFALLGELSWRDAACFAITQSLGAIAGTFLAHAMFAAPIVQYSINVRTGGGQWLAEGVATFGLVLTILAGIRASRTAVPWLVGLYITAAYWFTASTSFANPAIAIGRAFTDTFSGIRLFDVPAFVASELAGATLAFLFVRWLFRDSQKNA